jgi:hypothetical protein
MMQTITFEDLNRAPSLEIKFIRAYLETAIWADLIDEDGDHVDGQYDIENIDLQCLVNQVSQCRDFIKLYSCMFNGRFEQAGHDLWLTRNGHGAGFWDRPEIYGENNAEQLTSACGHNTSFPELNITLENGLIIIE